MKITSYQDALDYVFLNNVKRDYTRKRIVKALAKLGSPHNNTKIIHVAWTNWKWSTCKMVFSILKHAWKRVACYTSPHLVDIRERFICESGMITEDELIVSVNNIIETWYELTYQEICITILFLFVQKNELEYVVLEVGCGWRLDATNFVNPIITAITSIWFDHTGFLWNTLEKISEHKAWIIKKWIPVVYNHENSVIKKEAQKIQAPIIFTKRREKTNLVWEFQEKNAWIAYGICKYILWPDHSSLIREWLMQVKHYGRLQYMSNNLLIDWAHNADWLRELKQYLVWISSNYRKIQLCFAQKWSKDWSLILETFWSEYWDYILVDTSSKILRDSEDLRKDLLWKEKRLMINIYKPEEIFTLANNDTTSLYVVFWSLYMIGEFLKFGSK